MSSLTQRVAVAAFLLGAMLGFLMTAGAQSPPGAPPGSPVPPGTSAPHGDHGTPQEWKFRWPTGDPARGREVFVKLECYSCHEVRGANFPAPSDEGKIGPELSAMGPLHEPEYFAEAIISPNALVEKGKGYEAPDGSSKMPSYNDAVTVQEVVDLVAFLRALRPPVGIPAGGGHGSEMKH